MGVLYTHSPKSPDPFSKLPIIYLFLIQKIQKNWDNLIGTGVDLRPAGDHWSPVSPGLVGLFPFFLNFFFFLPSTFCTSGQFFLIGCSTCLPFLDFSLKL
jgi:hypothetical protein